MLILCQPFLDGAEEMRANADYPRDQALDVVEGGLPASLPRARTRPA